MELMLYIISQMAGVISNGASEKPSDKRAPAMTPTINRVHLWAT